MRMRIIAGLVVLFFLTVICFGFFGLEDLFFAKKQTVLAKVHRFLPGFSRGQVAQVFDEANRHSCVVNARLRGKTVKQFPEVGRHTLALVSPDC